MSDPLHTEWANTDRGVPKYVLNAEIQSAPCDASSFLKLMNEAYEAIPEKFRSEAVISLDGDLHDRPVLKMFYHEQEARGSQLEFNELARQLKGIPHTTPEKGKVLYDLILNGRYEKCIELGFASGVGSVYMASALERNGVGHLTSVDTHEAYKRQPLASETIKRFSLEHRVDLVFHEISYTWFLMDALERGITFDFCFLDGAHTWDVDGMAFSLLERVLTPGGLIVFDDLDWCYANSPTMSKIPVPERMRQTPAVRKIFELLVKPNPLFCDVYEIEGMGVAKKLP
ncbi:class I SAM-dependent methyltransferase [Rhizobium sp. Root483D2]|uniref:O-methyltransferase n=1 Tax=Rhizobium sp. Root483D2 TaxID=1736545 RepID=UPI000712A5F9|nr:class I SAM-dependent methyltransferase [Rhizobium sp. Root483D2]KQY45718.1 hypothetical protein ASD32_10925 [Rhizobium sp. Root483D2]